MERVPTTNGRAWRTARSAVAVLLCAGLLVPAQGCVSKHTFRPDTFDIASGEDIHVYMKERRMIEFDGGEYRSIDSAGARYLVGKGIENRPDSADVKVPFSGTLPFSGIDRIEVRKVEIVSALYVIVFIGVFAALGFGTNLND